MSESQKSREVEKGVIEGKIAGFRCEERKANREREKEYTHIFTKSETGRDFPLGSFRARSIQRKRERELDENGSNSSGCCCGEARPRQQVAGIMVVGRRWLATVLNGTETSLLVGFQV